MWRSIEALGDLDAAAGGLDWRAVILLAGLVAGLAGLFLLLRWLLLRNWRSQRAVRAIWIAELVILPLAIWGVRDFLIASPLLPGAAEAMRIATGLALCLVLAWLVDRGVGLLLVGRGIDVPRILRTGIRVGLYALALAAGFAFMLGQDTIGFVVSGSVLIGVIGLALQGLLQDAFAGIGLSIEQPFRLGDWVELDDGTIGQVIDLTWRSTRLRSFQAGVIVLPNASLAGGRIHNHSQLERRTAVQLDVHLSNEIHPAKAKRLILEGLLATPEVLDHPTPVVDLIDASGHPYRYLMHFYCEDFPSKYRATSRVYENVWRTLRAEGIRTAPAAQEAALHRRPAPAFLDENIEDLIGRVPLFQVLTERERAALVPSIEYRVFGADEAVIREGEQGGSLFIVVGGRAEVWVAQRDEPVARLGVGDCFGEMSLLTGVPRSATVKTLSETTLLEIHKEALSGPLQERPELGEALARIEAQRQLELEAALADGADVTEEGIATRARNIVHGIRHFFDLGSGR